MTVPVPRAGIRPDLRFRGRTSPALRGMLDDRTPVGRTPVGIGPGNVPESSTL